MIKKSKDCPLKQAKFKDGTLVNGVKYQTLAVGEMTMCTTMYHEKGATVSAHKYHHEQIGYVVYGKLKLFIEGKESIIEKGDSYALPGNTEHATEAIEESLVIDTFTPIRKEYL